MFADELDAIAARVSAGTHRKSYIATHEDEYDEKSDADSICKDGHAGRAADEGRDYE